jgi:hypothetical protein
MTRLPIHGLFALALCGVILTSAAIAADSRDKLPKSKPAGAEAAKPQPPPAAAKASGRTDDFQDRDNNGVDDRHEKRAIRPEPAAAPTVKPERKPEASSEAPKAKPQEQPPAGEPSKPPAKSPPSR